MEKNEKSEELISANKELAFQQKEKGKRAAELVIADKELVYQKKEKQKRAEELVIANDELHYQNTEKEKRAAELVLANEELVFQNTEKEKLAAELIVANKELLFQNTEKEKRAAELLIANNELAFQNVEKEKRAVELQIANEELNEAKFHINELNIGLEQKIIERTAQLEAANKELESFSYSVSHDLRAPLRAINGFTQVLLEDYIDQLDAEARGLFDEILANSGKMGELIDNLLEFSRVGKQQISPGLVVMEDLVNTAIAELTHELKDRVVETKVAPLQNIRGDKNMLRQVIINLLSNAFKYTGKKTNALVEVGSYSDKTHVTYFVKDNGAGFDMKYYDKLFGVFQRLHSSTEFEGTGVGLAIIQRIITKHDGRVWATAKVEEGATFYITLPII